jgi:hypothetical protein
MEVELQVLMGMTLEEAIQLRDKLETFGLDDLTTPHYNALNTQILRAQKILRVA